VLSWRLQFQPTDQHCLITARKGNFWENYALVDEVCLTTLVSLDKEVTSSGEGLYAVVETVADLKAADPADEFEEVELRTLIREVVESLPEKERTVLNLYYYEELTLKEIGEVLGISESRVCQIHTKSVLRVKGRVHQILEGGPMARLGERIRRTRERRAAAREASPAASPVPSAPGALTGSGGPVR